MKYRLRLLSVVLFIAAGCGSQGGGGSASGVAPSPMEAKLKEISQESRIPYRLLLAVGFVESRFTPVLGYANYLNNETTDEQAKRGLKHTETAFGLSREALGLVEQANASDLLIQAEAYAKTLRASFDRDQVNLPVVPKNSEEMFQWIWELARIHRGGQTQSKNIMAAFSLEVGKALEKGFVWQQDATGDVVRLQVSEPRLKVEELSESSKANLEIRPDQRDDIAAARFLPLAELLGTDGNVADRVEVIHCPLSLSACLEIQTENAASQVRMGAHFVIPQSPEIIGTAIQVTPLNRAVYITDSRGNNQPATNRVVIMLVGPSGRLVDGVLKKANPAWISHWQLMEMAKVVSGVCARLEQDGRTTQKECSQMPGKIRSPKQIVFRSPEASYQKWGDIPDFDPKIFGAYLAKRGADLQGAAKFENLGLPTEIKAGQELNMILSFQTRAKLVVVENLVRCPNGSLAWSTVEKVQVRGTTRKEISTPIFSKGPNGDGGHFYRAKVYGNQLNLLGWDFYKAYVKDFEDAPDLSSDEACEV